MISSNKQEIKNIFCISGDKQDNIKDMTTLYANKPKSKMMDEHFVHCYNIFF